MLLAYWASIKSEKKKYLIQFHTTYLLTFSKFAGWHKVAQNKQNIKPLKLRLLTNTYMVSSTVVIIHTFFSPAQFSLSRKGGTYIFQDLAGVVMWIIYTSQNELFFLFVFFKTGSWNWCMRITLMKCSLKLYWLPRSNCDFKSSNLCIISYSHVVLQLSFDWMNSAIK